MSFHSGRLTVERTSCGDRATARTPDCTSGFPALRLGAHREVLPVNGYRTIHEWAEEPANSNGSSTVEMVVVRHQNTRNLSTSRRETCRGIFVEGAWRIGLVGRPLNGFGGSAGHHPRLPSAAVAQELGSMPLPLRW